MPFLRIINAMKRMSKKFLAQRCLFSKDLYKKDLYRGINELYYLIIFCLTCLSLLFVLINLSEAYRMLFVLPVIFLFGHFILWKNKIHLFSGIGILFIHLTYFIRMAIVPFIMCLGNFGSKASLLIYQNNIDTAIFLMAYEFALVCLMLGIYLKHNEPESILLGSNNLDRGVNASGTLDMQQPRNHTRPFKILFGLMVGTCAICFFLFPKLISYFYFYLSFDDVLNLNRLAMINSLPGEIYYPFKIIIELLRIIIPAIIVVLIVRLRIPEQRKLWVILGLMALVFTVTTGEQINSVKVIVVLLFISLAVCRYIKPLFLIGIAGCLLLILLGFVMQMSIKDPSRLSAVFQSYFSGPSNIAMGLTVSEQGNNYFLADFLKGLPLLSTFFKHMVSSTDAFNLLSDYVSKGQEIMPFICASANYFGFILAPLPSIIIVWGTLRFDRVFRMAKEIFSKYIYGFIALSMALTPVMYSPQIFYCSFLATMLPLLFILYCNSKGSVRDMIPKKLLKNHQIR